ncbi:MAG: sensor histidine kinase [Chakrabartia godavariana]
MNPGAAPRPRRRTPISAERSPRCEAGEIIRRIRSFTADGEVSAAPHCLRDLVFRALSSLFGRAGSAEIAIINAVPKAIMVQVEPMLVEHAISNVVRNAVDAMAGQTGGRLLITAVPGADTISLEIADNGPGIRADMADNIFSPFVTNKAQGTGLGLAISRTMVEAIGGKILLKRHAPGDTAFCLTLPRAATPEHDVEG